MPAKQSLVAKVNVIGPDGKLCPAGAEIPKAWLSDPEFDVEHLVKSGGARKKG